MIAFPLAQKLTDVFGTWGRPHDEPTKVAAALAILALVLAIAGRGRSLLGVGPAPVPRRLFLWITAFAAALLSIFYIAIYLRGGPRIIDATTYFMQGRALSHGDFAWNLAEPTASVRGRFLLYREVAGGEGVMGGIFPPGYPMLLALGFGMGAPMVVGPAIAAALVIATYRLAKAMGEEALAPATLRSSPASRDMIEAVARAAALVSVLCAALRYHTADTMAHGATALGIALALEAALRKRAVVAGLCVGAVVATRPVSAVAIAIVAAWLLVRASSGTTGGARRAAIAFAAGVLPGVLLLVGAQHAVTGAWLASTQKMYYATSDGPPGCFRWGFGADVGCLYEHGDFVKARLANGYGLLAAAGTTLRRLRMHILDVANLEPLALLVLVPFARPRAAAKRSRAVLAAGALVLLHVLMHAPFYFDGNYPGGGARFFADVLPVEHVLLALAVARLVSAPRFVRAAFVLFGASAAGFAIHAAYGHDQLASRDGGRPMYEPDLVARANVTSGLVFVDTDHALSLGYDPEARIKNNVLVARLRNDDRDRLLFDRLDHPPTFLYKFDPALPYSATTPPPIVPWAPAALGDTLRFEAEAEWPAIAQTGGFAVPAQTTDWCASQLHVLALVPSPLTGTAHATITVPVPKPGRYVVSIRVAQGTSLPFAQTRGPKPPNGAIMLGKERWEWVDILGGACADLADRELYLAPPAASLVLEASGGSISVDRINLKWLP